MTQRATVVAEARSWIGTPFHFNACIKGVGVACGPFLCAVLREAGINAPDPATLPHFSADWHMHTREERFLAIVEQFGRYVDAPQPGDVAMFRLGWTYSHGGIVVEWPRIIHARWGAGVEHADATIDPWLLKSGEAVKFLSPWA